MPTLRATSCTHNVYTPQQPRFPIHELKTHLENIIKTYQKNTQRIYKHPTAHTPYTKVNLSKKWNQPSTCPTPHTKIYQSTHHA